MGWLDMPEAVYASVEETDGSFKNTLDRTKYASRYPKADKEGHLFATMEFLEKLDRMLDKSYLFADTSRLPDVAIFPAVRQFDCIDNAWFDAQDWPSLHRRLESILASELFSRSCQNIPSGKAGMRKRVFLRCSDAV